MTEHLLEGKSLEWLLESATDAMIIIDRGGQIVVANPTVERLFGHPRQELVGQSIEMLLPERFRHAHQFQRTDYFVQPHARGMGAGMELLGLRKDGSEFFVDVSLSPLKTEQGLLVMATIHDITRRKQAEQQRDRLLRELESANEELKNFGYVVSHDLKAPLRAIGSLANWLSTDYADKFDDEGKEHMRLLIGRVHRMDRLIDGILQYSRVGRVKEVAVAVDLNQLVREVIDLLAPPANFTVSVENALPTVMAEPTRLQQVFQNLLSNAINYMDKPAGEIRIACDAEGTTQWKFSITDNGPGIDQQHFEKIFQLFQTLAPRDRVESTGVGLSLVKKIVEMYGGRVWLESTVGRGSTFFFTLPRAAAASGSTKGKQA